MKLETLFAGVEYTGTLPQGDVTLVTQDSRRAGPGAVFVCAKGHTTDGHTFAQKALEAGAACIVTERPLGLQREVQVENGRKAYARLCANYFGHPAEKLRLVAVTGTNGKTTVRDRKVFNFGAQLQINAKLFHLAAGLGFHGLIIHKGGKISEC